MINCGGGDEIVNLFSAPPETKVYVLDSHRPLSLENLLTDNNHICVFDDESESSRVTEAINAYEKMMAAEDEENIVENDSDSSMDEDGRPRDNRSRQRRRLNGVSFIVNCISHTTRADIFDGRAWQGLRGRRK